MDYDNLTTDELIASLEAHPPEFVRQAMIHYLSQPGMLNRFVDGLIRNASPQDRDRLAYIAPEIMDCVTRDNTEQQQAATVYGKTDHPTQVFLRKLEGLGLIKKVRRGLYQKTQNSEV